MLAATVIMCRGLSFCSRENSNGYQHIDRHSSYQECCDRGSKGFAGACPGFDMNVNDNGTLQMTY